MERRGGPLAAEVADGERVTARGAWLRRALLGGSTGLVRRAGGDSDVGLAPGAGWPIRVAARVGLAMTLGIAAQTGCAHDSELERQLEQVTGSLRELELAGARRCAPRELAVAQSQLSFAELDREQGQARTARAHLTRARENVQAARVLLALSPFCRDASADAGPPPAN